MAKAAQDKAWKKRVKAWQRKVKTLKRKAVRRKKAAVAAKKRARFRKQIRAGERHAGLAAGALEKVRSRVTTNPSAPGEFPRKVTGHLRRNVLAEFDPAILTSRVGTNVPYGKFLELGTSAHVVRVKNAKVLTNGAGFFGKEVTVSMAPRPWLSRAYTMHLPEIKAILAGTISDTFFSAGAIDLE